MATVLCNGCQKEISPMNRCGKCMKIYYCERECQVQDWKKHKLDCKTQSIQTETDRLEAIVALVRKDATLIFDLLTLSLANSSSLIVLSVVYNKNQNDYLLLDPQVMNPQLYFTMTDVNTVPDSTLKVQIILTDQNLKFLTCGSVSLSELAGNDPKELDYELIQPNENENLDDDNSSTGFSSDFSDSSE